MIEMTLHAVTVRCESLPEALSLLDRWARMGEITLPPAPRETSASPAEPFVASPLFVQRAYDETLAMARAAASPSVPEPARPTKHKPRSEALQERPCGVCDEKFEAPVGSRLVTCKDHRLKPGQNLAHERARYQASRGKAAPKGAPGPATKSPVDRAAAKSLLARPPIKPTEATKPCSVCGDKVRVADVDAAGRCKDCQPIGGSK